MNTLNTFYHDNVNKVDVFSQRTFSLKLEEKDEDIIVIV